MLEGFGIMSWTNWDEDTDDNQTNEVWVRGWLNLEFGQRGESKKELWEDIPLGER